MSRWPAERNTPEKRWLVEHGRDLVELSGTHGVKIDLQASDHYVLLLISGGIPVMRMSIAKIAFVLFLQPMIAISFLPLLILPAVVEY